MCEWMGVEHTIVLPVDLEVRKNWCFSGKLSKDSANDLSVDQTNHTCMIRVMW